MATNYWQPISSLSADVATGNDLTNLVGASDDLGEVDAFQVSSVGESLHDGGMV